MITEQTDEQQVQEALQDYLANGGVVEIIPPRCKTTSKLPNPPTIG